MTPQEIEQLPIDMHGIALANGLPSGVTAHPAFKMFLREYKCALAAMVLERAAKRYDDLGWGKELFTEDIADDLRNMAKGLG